MKGCVQKCNVHLCFGGGWEILIMKGCVQKCNFGHESTPMLCTKM